MGRLGGFFGGAVLTSSVIYLATQQLVQQAHRSSRTLRESADILDAVVDKSKTPVPITPARKPEPMMETFKGKWNAELEGAYKWIQGMDMTRIRETAEDVVTNVYRNLGGKA